MINIDSNQINGLEKHYRINLINSLIGYRSLNLLGTVNENGIPNLCVVSSAFHLGANPPLLGLVMRPQREHNDSLKNIKSTQHFTLNNVQPSYYMQAHQTSASYPSGVSEFDCCGFNEVYLDRFKAPFVTESTVKIGLALRDLLDIKLNDTTIVIGEIVHILTDQSLIGEDGTINHIGAQTVTVSGLDAYFLPQPLERLAYAKPNIEPHILKK